MKSLWVPLPWLPKLDGATGAQGHCLFVDQSSG